MPGSYKIWTADKDGNPILFSAADPPVAIDSPDPSDPRAVDIYFGLDKDSPQPPDKDQVACQDEIDRVLNVVRRLYFKNHEEPDIKFRRYYTRLFRLSQIGLEGPTASPDIARGALSAVSEELIFDEAGRVKNGHLLSLGTSSVAFALPLICVYFLLNLVEPTIFEPHLTRLAISRSCLANFTLLLTGCALGVWLSYGIRTSAFTLSDLTSTDSDRLLPNLRLLFASSITMVLGLLFASGIVKLEIGGYPVTEIATRPDLALLVGIFCGLSELSLPATIAKRASSFIGDIK